MDFKIIAAQVGWRAVYEDAATGVLQDFPVAAWFVEKIEDGEPRAYGMIAGDPPMRLYAAGYGSDPGFIGLLAPLERRADVYGR